MSPTLPDDVIPLILCRLPVKDLLRHRSVSKAWRSLIDGHDFIKLHLSRSHNNGGAIVRVRDRKLYWIYLSSPSSAAQLPNPIASPTKITEVIGSWNGLVVLQNFLGDVALWNPATRRHRRVPIPRAESEFPNSPSPILNEVVGFGHDPVRDDYKALRMVLFSDESVFTVYSLKAKRWNRVDGPSFGKCFRSGPALVQNSLHWIVVYGPELGSIFAFDVCTERFRQLAHPDQHGATEGVWAVLVELRGRLCVVCHRHDRSHCTVWMMKEYGARESWTKLLSVGPTEMGGPFWCVDPVAFVGDRVLLEKDGDVLVLYDLYSKSGQIVRISGVDGFNEVGACVESLVRLDWDGGDSVKEKPKRSGKKR